MECLKEIANQSSNTSSSVSWKRDTFYFSPGGHILLCLVYVAFITLCLAGNILLLLTIPFAPSLLSPMNFLLMNVCVGHIISSLSLLSFVFVVDVGTITSTHHSAVCSVTEGLGLFFIACGAVLMTLSAISFNRFLAIKYPTKQSWRFSRASAVGFNIFAWIFSASCMTPSMLSYKYYPEVKVCLRDWGNIQVQVYRLCLVLLAEILPITFIVLSFIAVKVTLKKTLPDMESNNNIRKLRMVKAERILGSLLTLFVICWLPFFSYWTIYSVSNFFSGCQGEIDAMKWLRITVLFSSIHGAIDPFIYTFGSSDLKKEAYFRACFLYNLISCSRSQNQVHPAVSGQGRSISLRKTYSQQAFTLPQSKHSGTLSVS